MYRNNPIQKLALTLLLLGAGALAVWGQSTRVDAASLVRPAGSAGNVQYNNTSGIGGSPNLHWDNSNAGLLIGQPSSGTARLIVKGSNTNNTTFAFQGFDSGDAERSRITNGGYFQGAGISRIGFDYSAAFVVDARLYQPTSVVSTATSGSTALVSLAGGFAPTSGNAVMNLVEVVGTVNQTGGANGKTRMLYLAANALSAANLYGLETVGGFNLIGNGSVPAEVMPRLAVVGLGNTAGTNAFCVYNTSSHIGLSVRDDGHVGIGNAAPAYPLDVSGNSGIRLPLGTTSQRPAGTPAGVLRYNASDQVFEGANGSAWVSLGAAASNYTEEISPSQITADQHDFSPPGLSTAAILRLYSDGTFRKITGLAGGASKRRILILNTGDYTLMFKHESTASAAANRFDFDADDLFVFPKEAVEFYYDNTASRWRCLSKPGSGDNLDYVTTGCFRHGVAGSTGSSITQGDFYVKANSGGTGSGTGTTPFAASGMTTGTSATGNGSIGATSQYVRPTAFTYLTCSYSTYVDALSDGTNTYTTRIGWLNTAIPSGEPTHGVYFRYTDGVNAGNYQFVARSGGTETLINTGTAPTTSSASPQSLKVVIDPSGAQVEGFIDGQSVGVITTNIPTSTNLGHYAQIQKTAGTTTRTLYLSGANFRVVTNTRR
ncbi:MAG: hypothetical protein IT260_08370 [Saprospiraceae bacterium]|nr:hypothetical protein [Saprospiraceae bacterium]